jgi:sulfur-oxidizing protein SoxA
MLKTLTKISAIVALATCAVNAGEFNAQAEKDRLALVKYLETKFDGIDNKHNHFPYSTEEELTNNFPQKVVHEDFRLGSYSFNAIGKSTYDEVKDMPPYEEFVEAGEELYNKPFANGKSFKDCFPDPAAQNVYPKFDTQRGEVVSLTQLINECRVENGEKKWKTSKGAMANLEAYFSYSAQEAEKKVDIAIPSADAAAAYERGKEYYYSQRGYLKLSCANCHVQGAGQRVRNEYMSPLLGHTTHFPTFRLKWSAKDKNGNGLGTLERRMSGCIKDQGQNPPKATSKEMKELLYFMSYMSNGMPVDGPDIRK